MIYYRLHAIHTSHNPYMQHICSSLAFSTTCYMLHTTCFTTGDVLNFSPICAPLAVSTSCYTYYMLYYKRHTQFYFIVTWLSQSGWPTLPHFSSHLSTNTFLSCTHILTPLKSFILYFMLDIFCLASIHARSIPDNCHWRCWRRQCKFFWLV